MRLSPLLLAAALAAGPAFAQTTPMSARTSEPADPYRWLEDKDGARPLAWVEAENARSLPRLQSDPRYQTFYREALAIAAAKDRIPAPELTYGRVLNFWSNGDFSGTGNGPIDYGVAVATHNVALDYVGGGVAVATPEPGAVVLLGSGLLGMLVWRRRSSRQG